jgi:glycosyltransferase involved in cell wall biosynthesis
MSAARGRGRLLFLSPIIPADRGNGLALRGGFFLDAYSRHFDIDLAVFQIMPATAEITVFQRARVRRFEIFARPAADTHFTLVSAMTDPAARLDAFRRYGQPSLASFAGPASRQELERWVGDHQYDVVHVARLYLAPLAAPWDAARPRPRVVIDCDEDDVAAHRRMAAMERRRNRHHQAEWAEAEADAFARMAQQVLRPFDVVFAASAVEAKSISARGGRTVVVPNVASAGARQASRRRSPATILFVGAMGYPPNDDAARWLLTRIWARLRRSVRSPLRLVLVGSNPSASLIRLGRRRDVLVAGAVADVAPFYRNASLAVVPIRAGGGTRIKLLEAAAHGIPIVSTTLGAEGTTFRNRHELLLADNEEAFVRACAGLLLRPAFAQRLAARARRRVERDYSADRWALRVGRLVADLASTHVKPANCEETDDGRVHDASRRPGSP